MTRRELFIAGLAVPISLQLVFSAGARATDVGVLPFLGDNPNPQTSTAGGDKIIPFDLTRLTTWMTPAEEFYIRNHFDVPDVPKVDDWAIRVDGRVKKPMEFSFERLRELPRIEQVVTLECAGNAKHRNHGLVSNARWAGVPLRALLDQVGLMPESAHIVFHGADSGGGRGRHFSRALSIEHAMQPDVMLATEMNGGSLPADHGFPVRLIVPGWYGMAHVKWLKRIEVIDRPFDGIYQTTFYVNQRAVRKGGHLVWQPESITRIPVKSVVARVQRESRASGNVYRVSGAVWGGDVPVKAVEVNINGDATWHPVSLSRHAGSAAWTLWAYQWHNPESGAHQLMSRGIDGSGRIQPTERSPLLRGPYQHDEVIVRRVKLSAP